MKKLVIYGMGDFARMIRYYFDSDSDYRVVSYCADESFVRSEEFDGLPLLGLGSVQAAFPRAGHSMFVAVGYSRMRARKDMFERARGQGYVLASYLSSRAGIDPSVRLGENNAIFQAAQLEPFVELGDNNIVWTSSVVCHDAKIGSHCFIAAQALLGGHAKVGDGCFVGFGSTVIQRVCLAEESLVGAKALVLGDTQRFSRNMGIPSRLVGSHEVEGICVE